MDNDKQIMLHIIKNNYNKQNTKFNKPNIKLANFIINRTKSQVTNTNVQWNTCAMTQLPLYQTPPTIPKHKKNTITIYL